MDSLRLVCHLVDAQLCLNPVWAEVVHLLIEHVRVFRDRLITEALRVEQLLVVVDLPVKRSQILLLLLQVMDTFWMDFVARPASVGVHVIAGQ